MVDITIREGLEAQFETRCLSKPDADLAWFKDGQIISLTNRMIATKKDTLNSLKFTKVERGDIGKYSLIARNPLGEAKSTATLSVTGTANFRN